VDQHSADVALVQRCLAGDERAREQLVARVRPVVLSVCRRMLGTTPDAEDTAQEVFLRVFKHLRSWDQSRPLHSWVASIAVNRCRTTLARNARWGPVLEPTTDIAAPAQERQDAEPSEALTAALRDALATLRPEYRLVVLWFHLEGVPYEVIAQRLGRPVGTVKTWLHRARAELARYLMAMGWDAETVNGCTVRLSTLQPPDQNRQ